jgi:hypothetical protein
MGIPRLLSKLAGLLSVAETAGMASGKIVDSGSNANGNWVKYSDGTMICWNRTVSQLGTTTASGQLFMSDIATWTFPVSFSSLPIVTPRAYGSSVRWGVLVGEAVGSATLRIMSTTSSATVSDIGAIAVGRWY